MFSSLPHWYSPPPVVPLVCIVISEVLTREVAAQLLATLLILHNLRTQDLFAMPGWHLGASWILVTVSYSLLACATVVVAVLGKFSPDEYILIPNL